MNNKYLLLLLFVILAVADIKSQEKFNSDIDNWKAELFAAIDLELTSHFKNNCKQDHYQSSINFFENELRYFPILKSFEKLERLLENKRIKSNSRIFLVFYYPIVGFDSETGYETSIIIKRRFGNLDFYKYDTTTDKFVPEVEKFKFTKKMMRSKSDCYGTGYSLITVFDGDLEIEKIKVSLAIEL